MSGRYNDFDDEEFEDEELDDGSGLDGPGRSPNNPMSGGASVRGAGVPPAPQRPSIGNQPAPASGARPSAPSPSSPSTFGAPMSTNRPGLSGPGGPSPSSTAGGVQPYQRPQSGSPGSAPGSAAPRPGDPRPASSMGGSTAFSSSSASQSMSRPGDTRSPLPGSTSNPSGARPASSPLTRPDERKSDARSEGGGIGSKVGNLFGRGDKKEDKPATPKNAPAGRPADPKGGKSESGGGLLNRFGIGGKDDKSSKPPSASSTIGSSTSGMGASNRPLGSSGTMSSGASASSASSSAQRSSSATTYGAATSQAKPQAGRSAGKSSAPKQGLLSRLNPFGPRDSATAKTARTGPAVEMKPISLALDKQLEIVGFSLFLAGIVLLLSSLSPVQGSIPQNVNNFLSTVFGWGAVVIPIVMVPLGIWLIAIRVGQETPIVAVSRLLGLLILFVAALVAMQFIDALSYPPGDSQSFDQYLVSLERVLLPLSSEFGRGGGRIGGLLYFHLIRNFSEIGGFVILLGVLVVGLMMTLSMSAYEFGAVIVGSTRNLRDASRRRSTRIAAERAAAQAVTVSKPNAAAATLPAPGASPALSATTGSTQPLPLEAPAAERSIPILMGGRPLTPGAEAEVSAATAPIPFPAMKPVPAPVDVAAKPATDTLSTPASESSGPAQPTGLFGRLKGALPAVGAAAAGMAKSTVSAITPDKEGAHDAPAPTVEGEPARKPGLFSRASASGPAEAAPASASAAPRPASPTNGTSKPDAPDAGKPVAFPSMGASPASIAKPTRDPFADDDDDFDDELLPDDGPPPRLGDLLKPSTPKPEPSAATAAPPRPSAPSGVNPYTPRPYTPPGAAAPMADSSTSKNAGAEAVKPDEVKASLAAASEAAKEPPKSAPARPVSKPAEGIRKPAAPLEDDDWSSLPPARPKSAADHHRPTQAAPKTPEAAGDLQPKLEALRSPAPARPAEPVMAPPADKPRPWEANKHTAAPDNPPTHIDTSRADDKDSGVASTLLKAGAAVLGGAVVAAAGALRHDDEDEDELTAPRHAQAPKPAAGPAPFSRATTTAPNAAPNPIPPSRPAQPAPTAASRPGGRANWRLPDFTGLLASGGDQEMDHDKLLARARTIEDTLASFGAPGRVVEVRTGPVITQFGVEPDYVEVRGRKNRVKVGQIANLDKDLQLSLGAKSIRIEAPVPGKGYVGIEVPNEKPAIVRLRDVMESNEFRRLQSPLAIALGQGVDGTPVAADLGSMPHLLIAGTTGSGKSVAVNTIIASLLLRNSPDRLKFIMVDPKRVELTGYNGIPHLVAPVVVELERVVSVLKWVTREMDERYRKFALAGARNIEDFNNHLPTNEPTMPYIVVIIDELADLMMMAPDDTEKVITRIAALARATGIHLVIATQRPSVDVVTGLIKANFPARIAFAVSAGVDSRVILDQPGAERLLGRGDMLFMSGDTPAPARLQGVYVSDTEIGNITRYWRNHMADAGLADAGKPILSDFKLDEEARQNGSNASGRGSGLGYGQNGRPAQQSRSSGLGFDDEPEEDDGEENADSDDLLYEKAVETVRLLNKASVSLLQRRLRIGYTRAARIIDLMEERGVIGPPVDGAKPRDVLPPDKSKP